MHRAHSQHSLWTIPQSSACITPQVYMTTSMARYLEPQPLSGALHLLPTTSSVHTPCHIEWHSFVLLYEDGIMQRVSKPRSSIAITFHNESLVVRYLTDSRRRKRQKNTLARLVLAMVPSKALHGRNHDTARHSACTMSARDLDASISSSPASRGLDFEKASTRPNIQTGRINTETIVRRWYVTAPQRQHTLSSHLR